MSVTRREQVSAHKRQMILDAARAVFAKQGLDGASLRSIALSAGYTPAALYFHFESKEAIYAELLRASLMALGEAVVTAVSDKTSPEQRLIAAAMAFFHYYADNPGDLDLGFYLLRGGMKPAGLGPERDKSLNDALERALHPIAAAAIEMGESQEAANLLMVDCFAHASGLLLLLHTGRIRMFGASAEELMRRYVQSRLSQYADSKK